MIYAAVLNPVKVVAKKEPASVLASYFKTTDDNYISGIPVNYTPDGEKYSRND